MIVQLTVLMVVFLPSAFSSRGWFNECPAERPEGKCIGHAICEYGQECCCGSCYPSFRATCFHGKWMGMYTDACMYYGNGNCPGDIQTLPTASPSAKPSAISKKDESESSFIQITFNEQKKLDDCSYKGTSMGNKPMNVKICMKKCVDDPLCKGITYDNDYDSCYICDTVDVIDFMHERDIYLLDTGDNDCVGKWSTCSSSCEMGSERVWEEIRAPSGRGKACPVSAPDCQNNEDACNTQSMHKTPVKSFQIFYEYEQTTIKGETINKCGKKKGAIDTNNIVECEDECRSCNGCVAFVWYYDDNRETGPRCVMKRKSKLKHLKDATFDVTTYVLGNAEVSYDATEELTQNLFAYNVLHRVHLLNSLALVGFFSITYQCFRYVSMCCSKRHYAEINEADV